MTSVHRNKIKLVRIISYFIFYNYARSIGKPATQSNASHFKGTVVGKGKSYWAKNSE